MKQHIISIKVENKSGVLSRVVGLVAARGYNIDSLTVCSTEDENISILTLVVKGDDRVIEQVKKQLNKLIDVMKISDHTDVEAVQRQLLLIKINSTPAKRAEIIQLGEIFKASIADISHKSITFSMKGTKDIIDNFIELLRPYGIKEFVRTGRISLLKDQ